MASLNDAFPYREFFPNPIFHADNTPRYSSGRLQTIENFTADSVRESSQQRKRWDSTDKCLIWAATTIQKFAEKNPNQTSFAFSMGQQTNGLLPFHCTVPCGDTHRLPQPRPYRPEVELGEMYWSGTAWPGIPSDTEHAVSNLVHELRQRGFEVMAATICSEKTTHLPRRRRPKRMCGPVLVLPQAEVRSFEQYCVTVRWGATMLGKHSSDRLRGLVARMPKRTNTDDLPNLVDADPLEEKKEETRILMKEAMEIGLQVFKDHKINIGAKIDSGRASKLFSILRNKESEETDAENASPPSPPPLPTFKPL